MGIRKMSAKIPAGLRPFLTTNQMFSREAIHAPTHIKPFYVIRIQNDLEKIPITREPNLTRVTQRGKSSFAISSFVFSIQASPRLPFFFLADEHVILLLRITYGQNHPGCLTHVSYRVLLRLPR